MKVKFIKLATALSICLMFLLVACTEHREPPQSVEDIQHKMVFLGFFMMSISSVAIAVIIDILFENTQPPQITIPAIFFLLILFWGITDYFDLIKW